MTSIELKVNYQVFDNNRYKVFYLNKFDQLHNDFGPAQIEYLGKNGEKSLEVYYFNGKRHHLNGPAQISYDSNGDVEEHYIINDKHIKDGPCILKYNKDNVLIDELYWSDDPFKNRFITKEEYFEIQNDHLNNKIVEIDGIKYKLILQK